MNVDVCIRKHYRICCEISLLNIYHVVSGNNDAEEESDEDEDYVPSEDWKKVC